MGEVMPEDGVGQAGRAVSASLDAAERHCAQLGVSLTPLRRQVLGVVLEADAPVGAYAILDRLKDLRGSAAPPTVYRALDFLVEQRLVHKVERLNAFIACAVPGEGSEAEHDHAHCAHHHEGSAPPQFLICERCGGVTELADEAVVAVLQAASRGAGFVPSRMTVEVEGVCARCVFVKAGSGA